MLQPRICFYDDAATFGGHELMTLRLVAFVQFIDGRLALSMAEGSARS